MRVSIYLLHHIHQLHLRYVVASFVIKPPPRVKIERGVVVRCSSESAVFCRTAVLFLLLRFEKIKEEPAGICLKTTVHRGKTGRFSYSELQRASEVRTITFLGRSLASL